MANPYTSVSVAAAYNADPPSNDASETSNNQLGWDKHVDKLADPLKTAIEAINTNVSNAFARRFGTKFEAKTTNYVVVVADQGKFFSVTGTTTITLLPVGTANVGFPIAVRNNGSDVVTIDGDGAETINGSATILLYPGDSVLLTTDGIAWVAEGVYTITGTFTPNYSSGFSSAPTGDISYIIRNNIVYMTLPGANGTSNANSFVIDNLPAAATPSANKLVMVPGMVDNGTDIFGQVAVTTSTNSLVFYPEDINALWTASGSKGFGNNAGVAPNIIYPLRI